MFIVLCTLVGFGCGRSSDSKTDTKTQPAPIAPDSQLFSFEGTPITSVNELLGNWSVIAIGTEKGIAIQADQVGLLKVSSGKCLEKNSEKLASVKAMFENGCNPANRIKGKLVFDANRYTQSIITEGGVSGDLNYEYTVQNGIVVIVDLSTHEKETLNATLKDGVLTIGVRGFYFQAVKEGAPIPALVIPSKIESTRVEISQEQIQLLRSFIELHERSYGGAIASAFESIVVKARSINILSDKEQLKILAESILPKPISLYNSEAVNLGRLLNNGEVQCYSGTSYLVAMLASLYSFEELNNNGFIVITTQVDGVPHVLPGFLRQVNGDWEIVGIEMTSAGNGIVSYGPAKKPIKDIFVLPMNEWLLTEVESQKTGFSIDNAWEKVRNFHAKFQIPFVPQKNSVPSGDIKPVSKNPIAMGSRPLQKQSTPRSENTLALSTTPQLPTSQAPQIRQERSIQLEPQLGINMSGIQPDDSADSTSMPNVGIMKRQPTDAIIAAKAILDSKAGVEQVECKSVTLEIELGVKNVIALEKKNASSQSELNSLGSLVSHKMEIEKKIANKLPPMIDSFFTDTLGYTCEGGVQGRVATEYIKWMNLARFRCFEISSYYNERLISLKKEYQTDSLDLKIKESLKMYKEDEVKLNKHIADEISTRAKLGETNIDKKVTCDILTPAFTRN
jgi:hypothetical protein